MDLSIIVKLLVTGCGVYMMYWAVQMKSTNKIPAALIGKNFPIARAKDPDGFIKLIFPFTLGTGVIVFAAGLVSVLDILKLYPIWDMLLNLVVVMVVVIYGIVLMKAQQKYLVGITGGKK